MNDWLTFSYLSFPKGRLSPLDVEVSNEHLLIARLIESCGFTFNCEQIQENSNIYRFQISYRATEVYAQFGAAASSKKAVQKLIDSFKTVDALKFKEDIDSEVNLLGTKVV